MSRTTSAWRSVPVIDPAAASSASGGSARASSSPRIFARLLLSLNEKAPASSCARSPSSHATSPSYCAPTESSGAFFTASTMAACQASSVPKRKATARTSSALPMRGLLTSPDSRRGSSQLVASPRVHWASAMCLRTMFARSGATGTPERPRTKSSASRTFGGSSFSRASKSAASFW